MEANNGTYIGQPNISKRKSVFFRPVSVKKDGRRVQSANWCVRFPHKGKRTCRSLGTAEYRLANQRAKQLVAAVRHKGWASALELPTSHGSLLLEEFLERFQRSAVSRGLRPRSINADVRALSTLIHALRTAMVGAGRRLPPVPASRFHSSHGVRA